MYLAAIPNALTIGRLIIAAVFFVVLSVYRYPFGPVWALPTAAGLFIVAAITDFIDGWLARRWKVVTVLGRIIDPLADKVLVIGAFILLAGSPFDSGTVGGKIGEPATSVSAWMVIVILARELLVTTIRAVFESSGVDFSASMSGKFKMGAQSVAVPLLLLLVWAKQANLGDEVVMRNLRYGTIFVAWATVGITAFSAIPYVMRAWKVLGWSALVPPEEPPTNP